MLIEEERERMYPRKHLTLVATTRGANRAIESKPLMAPCYQLLRSQIRLVK